VLDEEQPAARLQDPRGLSDRGAWIGNRAEHQGRHRGVEARVLERESFRRRFEHLGVAGRLRQLRPQPLCHVRIRLDYGQLIDRFGIQVQVDPGAGT
jgi:hypothetical protein